MAEPRKYKDDVPIFLPSTDAVSADFAREKQKMDLILNAGRNMTRAELKKKIEQIDSLQKRARAKEDQGLNFSRHVTFNKDTKPGATDDDPVKAKLIEKPPDSL